MRFRLLWALYIALGVVVIASIVLWVLREHLGAWAGAWMPNAGTEALAILVTIAVIDRILERRERERLRPRLNRVLGAIAIAWRSYVESLALDYAQTHLRNFRPLPDDLMGVVDLWIDQRNDDDSARIDPEPIPLIYGEGLAERLSRIRETDREVLEPALVAVLDDFVESARRARTLYSLTGLGLGDQEDAETIRSALLHIVASAKRLGEVILRYENRWPTLPEGHGSTARALRDKLLERGSASSQTSTDES